MINTPDRIKQLTETFHNNLDSYKKGTYNETQVRREYIDPLFEALGWDIANKKGYAEAYKDVIHEDAIKVGGATKAPDYCFRIGGVRKFFLEAKKPAVNIKHDIHPAYQLRRYGWSAKLPLSILTDFEEFSVYDCRVKPVKTDQASHSRIRYFKYFDYDNVINDIGGRVIDTAGLAHFRLIFDFGLVLGCQADHFAQEFFIHLPQDIGRQNGKFIGAVGIIKVF